MGKLDPEEKLNAPADFKGPIAEGRGCTDILFTLLLFAMWGAMTYLGYFCVQEGDFRVVTNPIDFDGNVCGTNYAKDMREFPYKYYLNFLGGGVCVKECPDLTPEVMVNGTNIEDPNGISFDPFTLITYDGVFQIDGLASDLSNGIMVADYSDSENKESCTQDSCFPNNDPVEAFMSEDGINQGYGYAFFTLDTRPFLNRCFPTTESVQALQDATGGEFLDFDFVDADNMAFFERFFSDCWTARSWVLGFGFCVALVISFVYLLLLRFPCILGIMIWGSILLTNALLIAGGAYLYLQADSWEIADPPTYSDEYIRNARILSYVLFALGAIFFLLVLWMRKEIQLALGIVKQTSKAINSMPLLSVFPVFQCLGLLVFLAIWMVYAVHLASLGTMTTITVDNPFNAVTMNMKVFEFSDTITYFAWFLLFCILWTYQFILSIGQIIIAMSVATWYFTRNKSSIGSTTVVKSICSSLWYHIGTAAFGSLIIAIVRIFRIMLAKLQKTAKDANNKFAEALLCACACCLWCLDNFLRFINKTAFIQTAIFGTSFCRGAGQAFYLIARNAAKIGAITVVSEIVSIVGKLFITVATGIASYVAMEYYIVDEVSSLAGPTVLVLILAYNVSDTFMDVFELGVSTILYCFIADDEMFTEEECFAEGDLKHLIDDWD